MKRLLLLSAGLLYGMSVFAQQQQAGLLDGTAKAGGPVFDRPVRVDQKVTKNGDTVVAGHDLSSDTLTLYVPDVNAVQDSGYLFGTNAFGDKGFAERYDIKSPDSTVLPLGVAAYMIGDASSTTTKTFRAVAWAQGAKTSPIAGRPHIFFTGFPTTVLNSVTVNLSSIRKANGTIDSFRLYRFASASTYVADSFFVGIDMTYNFSSLSGDTIGIVSTKNGERHQPGLWTAGIDTIVNVQNAVQLASGVWVDNLNGRIQGGHNSLYNHFMLYAVFRVKIGTGGTGGTGVNSVSRQGLTVFGTYPNPASNSAKLKLALKSGTTLNMQVVDAMGRTVYVAAPQTLSEGEHTLDIPTAQLASGTYYCMLRTAAGDGMGIEMTVAH